MDQPIESAGDSEERERTRAERELQRLERERRDRAQTRALALALGLAALAAPGLLPVDPPGATSGADPLALLAWLAVLAPTCGCAAVAMDLRAWPFAAAIPGAWMIALVIVSASAGRDVASPLWGMLAIAGLFAAGAGAAHLARKQAWSTCGALLLVGAGLAMLPALPGRSGAPWPVSVARVALDLSPITLVAECSGVDWMRSAAVYGPVGSDRFERTAYSGALAGPLCLVLGCALWMVAARVSRRRAQQAS